MGGEEVWARRCPRGLCRGRGVMRGLLCERRWVGRRSGRGDVPADCVNLVFEVIANLEGAVSEVLRGGGGGESRELNVEKSRRGLEERVLMRARK
ncbi:unnamed protein product [Staurois parvus]|uniref:Uncharacterized protein n=1 Tax=Staurois parvus TaxID=386267 RepID=A0ABN9E1X1_9NEOB|nr:unnamed protein product [Staurois parvus]